MLHIAGGIILAAIFLALFPVLLPLIGYVLIALLILGIAAFLVATESGRTLLLVLVVLGALAALFSLLVRTLGKVPRGMSAVSSWLQRLPSLRLMIAITALRLTPAFTESQKVTKLAQQIAHKNDYEKQMLERLERKRLNEIRLADELFLREKKKLIRGVQRLENKFAKTERVSCEYRGDDIVLSLRTLDGIQKIAVLRVLPPGTDSKYFYEVKYEKAGEIETEKFVFCEALVNWAKGFLRNLIAEQIATENDSRRHSLSDESPRSKNLLTF